MEAIFPLLILGAIVILVFLITREIWLWYWKVNKIIDVLERIDSKLIILKDNNK